MPSVVEGVFVSYYETSSGCVAFPSEHLCRVSRSCLGGELGYSNPSHGSPAWLRDSVSGPQPRVCMNIQQHYAFSVPHKCLCYKLPSPPPEPNSSVRGPVCRLCGHNCFSAEALTASARHRHSERGSVLQPLNFVDLFKQQFSCRAERTLAIRAR